MVQRKRLGEMLIEASLLTQDQLEEALHFQKGTQKRLGQILVEKGWVSEENLCRILSKSLHVRYVDVSKALISQEIIRLVSNELAIRHHVLPVLVQNTTLYVAMEDPHNINVIQQIEFKTGMQVVPLIAPASQLRSAIRRHYNINEYIGTMLANVKEKEGISVHQKGFPPESQDTDKEENEIIKLSRLIISEGIKARATDIHIEPSAHDLKVQYRIDGILTRGIKLPKEVHSPLLNRLKVIAGLDITEHRNPQDGHIHVTYQQRKVDLRVSTVVTHIGEKILIRVLDKKTRLDDITRLGFSPQQLEQCQPLIQQPQGLIVVTGPTGSGKTTTLYALLNALKNRSKHIITIEDPIEYKLEGMTQIQINSKAGVTFASSLRSVLRQNPNVILLGEIRDTETASVAIQAAESGHLVLSTLHTNDAISTMGRLLMLGISPDLVASNLLVAIAQQLVRRICPRCRTTYTPTDQELQRLNLSEPQTGIVFYKGAGCKICKKTGYYGQIGIFELFILADRIRAEIIKGTPKHEIRRLAMKTGMNTLWDSGLEKIRQGVTTIEEVLRVCSVELDRPEMLNQAPTLEKGIEKAQEQESILTTCAQCGAELKPEWVTCPICGTPKAAVSVMPPQQPVQPEITALGPRILVAEDEPAVRKVVQKLLQHKSYQVILAVDGEEALEKIHETSPDLVILDINMPKRDGFSVCEAMRSSVETMGIPVIMLTAQSSIESKLHGLTVGADDYMTKPFEPQELLARINAVLRRFRQTEATTLQ